MSSHSKRGRADDPGDDEKERQAQERRTEQSLRKIESHLFACFSKLHSTKVILGQAKANLEMVGGLASRQKEELKQVLSRLHASRRGPANDVRLTVVGEAAHQRYEKAMLDQIQELSLVEEALSDAHTVLAEDNEKRNGPWLTVPPIRARPESKPRTHPHVVERSGKP